MADENLSADVYQKLSERILSWEYPPGHRFTEEVLCEEFSVSRSPVREALGQLAERGLVVKKVRQGWSVRHIDLKEIHELYEVRLILELAVVERLCTQGIDNQRLTELEVKWRRFRDGLPEMKTIGAEADEEFHELLALSTGNRVLIRTLADIDKRIHFVRLSDITDPERFRKTCDDHLEILARIRDRDVAGSSAALTRNIEWGLVHVEEAVKDALARAYLTL